MPFLDDDDFIREYFAPLYEAGPPEPGFASSDVRGDQEPDKNPIGFLSPAPRRKFKVGFKLNGN